MEEFEYKGKSYNIYREENETDTVFYERASFIIAQEPATGAEIKEVLKLSRVWINMNFRQCRYSTDLEDKTVAMSNKIMR